MKSYLLIVDRDSQVREICRMFLEDCGYEVAAAGSALECFTNLFDRPPTALALEHGLMWGGTDGLLDIMREDSDLRSIPVILITTGEPLAQQATLLANPVVACLEKPFRMSKLLKCLESADLSTREIYKQSKP